MASVEQIHQTIENEYRVIKGKAPQFDRSKLPRVMFCMEDKQPSLWSRLKQKDLHSVLHKLFLLPVIGPFINGIFIVARLPHHIHKLRAELFELRMEFKKFEGQFSSDTRNFNSQTRKRFEKIEQSLKKLES